MGIGLVLVAIAWQFASAASAEKWFSWPNAIGLLPIPLS